MIGEWGWERREGNVWIVRDRWKPEWVFIVDRIWPGQELQCPKLMRITSPSLGQVQRNGNSFSWSEYRCWLCVQK